MMLVDIAPSPVPEAAFSNCTLRPSESPHVTAHFRAPSLWAMCARRPRPVLALRRQLSLSPLRLMRMLASPVGRRTRWGYWQRAMRSRMATWPSGWSPARPPLDATEDSLLKVKTRGRSVAVENGKTSTRACCHSAPFG